MSKLVNKAKSSKLRENFKTAEGKPLNKEKVINKNKPKEYPRSYRLDPEIMDMLKDTLVRINKVAPKKVSEAKLIKALIILSKEMENDEIIKALKEVW